MVLNFKFNVLLNFISVYFVFYISFDLFLSETKIYSTKICEFFVGSSRPPYSTHSSQAPFTARCISRQNTKWRSDDDGIPFLAAVATYKRRHLPRNKGFYENILLAYKLTIDEFKSHFRMTRGIFEALCREVQATGRVPKFLNQEQGHDRLSIRRKRRRRKPPS